MERPPRVPIDGQSGDIRWGRTDDLLVTTSPEGTCLSNGTDMVCMLNNGVASFRHVQGALSLGTDSNATQVDAVHITLDPTSFREATDAVLRHASQNNLANSILRSAAAEVERNSYATVQIQKDLEITEMDRLRWAIENPALAGQAAMEDIGRVLNHLNPNRTNQPSR